MTTRHVVGIASVGRPAILGETVRHLSRQTRPPDEIVVAIVDVTDASDRAGWGSVRIIQADRGLTKQRNAILDVLDPTAELVTFLDDDVHLADDYIEAVQRFAARAPDVPLFSGRVVRDGAVVGEISRGAAADILAQWTPEDAEGPAHVYGCNMTARADVARAERFDERLSLYGWLEDRDFAMRCARRGRIAQYGGAGLVHLGSMTGRVSAKRVGFSQVVNPIYLWRKGSFAFRDAASLVAKAIAGNLRGLLRGDEQIDRPGRLRGNLAGCFELLRGCRPERVTRY